MKSIAEKNTVKGQSVERMLVCCIFPVTVKNSDLHHKLFTDSGSNLADLGNPFGSCACDKALVTHCIDFW